MQVGADRMKDGPEKNQKRRKGRRATRSSPGTGLALAGLETRIGAVNDVDATAPTHKSAILVPVLYRLERIHNFHRSAAPL